MVIKLNLCELVECKLAERFVVAVESIADSVKRWVDSQSPPLPKELRFVVTGQFFQGDQKMLRFKVALPPRGASDVTTREFSLTIGSDAPITRTLPGDALETEEFEGADNSSLLASLVDVDDAGNRSPERAATGTLTDTIAPPQPGELGFVVTGET